jgi:NAD(P)-dependent dehydrogenase (short-subunit alcohol dehydrogenase family)
MTADVEHRKGLVIVTGGTRGVGTAVAAAATRAGHPVLVNFVADAQ